MNAIIWIGFPDGQKCPENGIDRVKIVSIEWGESVDLPPDGL
jgi:hypothetical protein